MSSPGFDPGAVGPAGFWYLALFGGLIPLAAIRSRRHLNVRPLPPKKRYFISVIVQQVLFLGVTLGTVWHLDLDLLAPYRPTAAHVALSAVMLVGAVALLRPTWRAQVASRERRLYLVTPIDRADHLLWAAISLGAGIGEELAYRGVMFGLVVRLTRSVPVAVGFCTIAFALGHALQGWRSAAVIGVFAAAFHGLVLLTGSLLPAMTVHVLYDVIAGFSYGRLARASGYPREPMPPPRGPNDWPARTPA